MRQPACLLERSELPRLLGRCWAAWVNGKADRAEVALIAPGTALHWYSGAEPKPEQPAGKAERFPVVFQQTPRKFTSSPPPDEIFPPVVAVVCVTLVSGVVMTIGGTAVGDVVKLNSSP